MKKLITTFCLFILTINLTHAQISVLPYTEGFESPFGQGAVVDFEPSFNGNLVTGTNRIYQDATVHNSGAASCAVVPTSSFDGVILIRMNLTSYSNVFVGFWAASGLNGAGNRSDLVEMSASIDNGLNYSPSTLIGDSSIFSNSNTAFNHYQYSLPYYTNNNSNVIVRIKVSRGDGSGTTAKWLLDDVTIDFNASDVTLPYIYDAYATSLNQIKIAYNEGVNSTGDNSANYTGLSNLGTFTNSSFNDTITIDLSTPLTEGHWYNLSISGIQDLAGNNISSSQQFIITFNDNTGNIKITEINYDNPGEDSLTFVEMKNMDSQPVNIGGWQFEKGLSGFFPSDKILQPGEYIIFTPYPSSVNSFFNVNSSQTSGGLDNSGENIAVYNSAGVLIDSVHYLPTFPWDTLANGYGHSLVLCNESDDNDVFSSWTAASSYSGIFQSVDSIFANPGSGCSVNSVSEIDNDLSNVNLFPNPANNILTINYYSEKNLNIKGRILTFDGKIVEEYNLSAVKGINSLQFDLDELSRGIYLLNIGSNFSKFCKN